MLILIIMLLYKDITMNSYEEYLDTIGRLYPNKLMAILEQNDEDELALACFDECLSMEEFEYESSKPGRVLDLLCIVKLLTLITIILGVC